MGQNLNPSLCSRKRSAHTRGTDTGSSSDGPGFQGLETGSRVSPAPPGCGGLFPSGKFLFLRRAWAEWPERPGQRRGWVGGGGASKSLGARSLGVGAGSAPWTTEGTPLILGLQAPLPHRGGPRAKRSAQGHREGLPGGQVALESWFLESGRSRTFSAAHPCGGATASAGLEVLHPPPICFVTLDKSFYFWTSVSMSLN